MRPARRSIWSAFDRRCRVRSSRWFAFSRAFAARCRSLAAFARSLSSRSGPRRADRGNTGRVSGVGIGVGVCGVGTGCSGPGSIVVSNAHSGIRVTSTDSQPENTGPSIGRPVKIFVEAHGCTQNYGEARLMQEALAGQGHALVTAEGDADAHVLVTCTVVETTERNMIRRMTELAAYDKPLIIAGCMAAAQRQRVLDTVPRAKLLPPRKWPQIVELLDAGTACGDRSADIESQSFGWHDAIIPIEQGCIGRCTYCITRVARGRVASYPVDTIAEQVRRSVDRGMKEIKLTGQDTAAYGLDAGTNLAALLRALDGLAGKFRVRVGLANPPAGYPIVDELVEAYGSEKIFKFLHLPVQSGDDAILEAMRRGDPGGQIEGNVYSLPRALPPAQSPSPVVLR